MNRSLLYVVMLALQLRTIASFAQPVRYAAEEPEQVVWLYLESEFAKASESPDYWSKVWTDRRLNRSDVRLGKPFSVYNLPPENLERFVALGDLLGASVVAYVSYPILDGAELIGTVQVSESGGRWGFVSHIRGSATDKLAFAFGEGAEAISVVGGPGIPAFILITPRDSSGMRAYPLWSPDPAFLNATDEAGTVSYRMACETVRPIAEQRLKEYRGRRMQGGDEQ